jgi:hypothetical protein
VELVLPPQLEQVFKQPEVHLALVLHLPVDSLFLKRSVAARVANDADVLEVARGFAATPPADVVQPKTAPGPRRRGIGLERCLQVIVAQRVNSVIGGTQCAGSDGM